MQLYLVRWAIMGFRIVGFPESVSNILKRQQLATKQGEGFIYFLTFRWYI